MIEERTEQLINRRLDGELTEAESLELDRLLIRSPEARLVLEEYQDMDALAGEALQSIFRGPDVPCPPDAQAVDKLSPGGATHRWNWAMGLAAAAMIALVLAGVPSQWAPREQPNASPEERPMTATNELEDSLYTRARPVTGTRNERQHITRNIIGVMDKDGENIYLLEVQRRDTTLTPVFCNY